MKKFLSVALIFALVFSALSAASSTTSQAATKEILIARLSGNTLTCHKSTFNTNLKGNNDWQWQNIVGYGKKLSYKVSSKCKFYLLAMDYKTLKKVNRSTFKKSCMIIQNKVKTGLLIIWAPPQRLQSRAAKW